MDNFIKVSLKSTGENESLARVIVANFISFANPTIEEICDIKTAVSEAVTNCIVHGYNNGDGIINITAKLRKKELYIEIEDFGKGIADVDKAREPLFTTQPESERSGMGFTVMEAFMDYVEVISQVGYGTKVIMKKVIGAENEV
jgi:stage II sporulation protein AB (anti-sigma F factor)